MKKRILLVTNGFPFGESERGFLSEEVKCLAKRFELLVFALENGEELLYPTDGIARIFRYSFSLFRNAFNVDALLRLVQPDTLAEVWHLLKKHDFSGTARCIKAVLSFRFHAWEMERKIGEIVQTERIDLVYTYWCNECTLAAVLRKIRFSLFTGETQSISTLRNLFAEHLPGKFCPLFIQVKTVESRNNLQVGKMLF